MATVFLTADQDAVVAEIEIAAPPQRVFAALTDPEQNKEWGQRGLPNYPLGNGPEGRRGLALRLPGERAPAVLSQLSGVCSPW